MTEKALDYNGLGLFYNLIYIISSIEILFPRSKLGGVSAYITNGI